MPSLESSQEKRGRLRILEAASGLVFGVLLAFGLLQLTREVLPMVGSDLAVPLGAIVGALLGMTRARALLWAVAAVAVAAIAVVGYTPLVDRLIQGVIRTDPLEPAPAVVVLAAALQQDGDLSDASQARLIHGYEVLGQGHAPRLVLTRLAWRPYSYVPTVQRQMRQLRMDFPIDEVGPVANTHDEAVAVARLARKRGWNRVILVSDPCHMRRAAGVFEKAGLQVLCSPCMEGQYDLSDLRTLSSRLTAFRDWAHEAIGFQVYRWRGWL